MSGSAHRICVLVFLGFLAITAGPAAAQPPVDSLTSGMRIRLLAPAGGVPWRTTAVIDSLVGATLHVRDLGEPRELRGTSAAVPLRTVRTLEVSTGRRSRWAGAGEGALWGLAAYAVIAATVIAHENATCESECFGGGFGWIAIAVGVPWSAGLGAVVGLALPVDRWRPVSLR